VLLNAVTDAGLRLETCREAGGDVPIVFAFRARRPAVRPSDQCFAG